MYTAYLPLQSLTSFALRCILSLLAILLTGCQQVPPASQKPYPAQHAVASAHPLATEAGLQILEQGGNAFDAAIAVAAVLGVVEPYSAGIGGGGFWLLHREADDLDTFIDARETAPMAAHKDLFLNADGTVNRDKAINSALSAGIPGQPAAFVHIAENYGNLPLGKTLEPAIKYAKQGFKVDSVYLRLARMRAKVLSRYPESRRIFLNDGNELTEESHILQPELAETLQMLADQGFNGFYDGITAHRLIASVTEAGGIWQAQDLKNYRVIERAPIRFSYQGATILPVALHWQKCSASYNTLSSTRLTRLYRTTCWWKSCVELTGTAPNFLVIRTTTLFRLPN